MWDLDCPDWVDEENSNRAEKQREAVLYRIVESDHEQEPTAQLVRNWHRLIFEGIAPHDDYVGNFRDLNEAPPCLQEVDIDVNGHLFGVHHTRVLESIEEFFEEFRSQVAALDLQWSTHKGLETKSDIKLLVKLAAWAHGEWIRIHPFLNGNGRTARLWANYVFTRYGFGPIIAVRPRPSGQYPDAAGLSMQGQHDAMERIFLRILVISVTEP